MTETRDCSERGMTEKKKKKTGVGKAMHIKRIYDDRMSSGLTRKGFYSDAPFF